MIKETKRGCRFACLDSWALSLFLFLFFFEIMVKFNGYVYFVFGFGWWVSEGFTFTPLVTNFLHVDLWDSDCAFVFYCFGRVLKSHLHYCCR